jgi:hypothetical protein
MVSVWSRKDGPRTLKDPAQPEEVELRSGLAALPQVLQTPLLTHFLLATAKIPKVSGWANGPIVILSDY